MILFAVVTTTRPPFGFGEHIAVRITEYSAIEPMVYYI